MKTIRDLQGEAVEEAGSNSIGTVGKPKIPRRRRRQLKVTELVEAGKPTGHKVEYTEEGARRRKIFKGEKSRTRAEDWLKARTRWKEGSVRNRKV